MSAHEIISMGSAHYGSNDSLITRGTNGKVTFYDKENFNEVKSFESNTIKDENNVRWIINVGNYYILQVDNIDKEILIFNDENEIKRWKNGQSIIKPIVIYDSEGIFLIFA